ncbi:uncharacterized protein [Panulirus ornatus]|uniref:uncharacterized protein n=1 Tax=Panulirus ornatus TaxID=150431 RepID=UPI003A83EE86
MTRTTKANKMGALVYIVVSMTLVGCLEPATYGSFQELEFRLLKYECEVLLKLYLSEWRFLTETSGVMDTGEVLSKRMFFQNFTRSSCEAIGVCGGEKSAFHEIVKVGDHEDRTRGDITSATENEAHVDLRDIANMSVSDIRFNIPSDDRASATSGASIVAASDPLILGARYAGYSELKLMLYDDKPVYMESIDARDTDHDGAHTTGGIRRMTNRDNTGGQEVIWRGAREAGAPVIYMHRNSRKTRKCAQVSGLLAGFNTFNYLTFVTGIITLILNVSNNINNNNSNNNLNNNNDISNNNVNANTNTQNANQVVIFPPGRKRRSIADWLLRISTSQAVTSPNTRRNAREGKHAADRVWSKTVPAMFASPQSSRTLPTNQIMVDVVRATTEFPWCATLDAVGTIVLVLDSWLEASTGMSRECGWAKYCHLLHHLTFKGTISATLAAHLKSFSNMVSPGWVGSTACLLHRARCSLL